MNEMIHWIVGPQMIGLVMLLAGYIQKRFPPKGINNLYGYRTQSSMKNQQTWELANSYSANLMIQMGLAAIVIGLALTPLIDMNHEYYMVIAILVVLFTIVILLMRLTERKLKQTFDKEGNAVL